MPDDCRVTPQTTPGDPHQKAPQPDVGRGWPNKHDMTDHKPPKESNTADAFVQEPKSGRRHRAHSQDSRQASEDRQQSEAGSGDEQSQPLVQYQDEEPPQYSSGYDGAEVEGQDCDMEGGTQQYGEEGGGGQQQYGSGDEEQAEGHEGEQAQYEEDAQFADAPTGQQEHNSGQDDALDEWDVPVDGRVLQHHDYCLCLSLYCVCLYIVKSVLRNILFLCKAK